MAHHELLDVGDFLATIDTLQNKQFSKRYFPNLNPKDINEIGLLLIILELLLHDHLPILVVLASEVEMVGLLDLQLVAN